MLYKRPMFKMGGSPTGIESLTPRVKAKTGFPGFQFLEPGLQQELLNQERARIKAEGEKGKGKQFEYKGKYEDYESLINQQRELEARKRQLEEENIKDVIKSKISDKEVIKSSAKTAGCLGKVLSYSSPRYILEEFTINLLSTDLCIGFNSPPINT